MCVEDEAEPPPELRAEFDVFYDMSLAVLPGIRNTYNVPWMALVLPSDKPGKSGVEVLDERDTDFYPSGNSRCDVRRYPAYFDMYADVHMV